MHKRVMDPADGDSGEDLILAVEYMLRHIRRSATTGGLSTAASAVLARLDSEGPQRLTELARAEAVSQPNMTQLVTRLERAGLVRRTADRSDGRGVVVVVTPTGVEVCRQRRGERAQALQALIAHLSEPERRAVNIALPALARAVEHQDRTASS
jgi:DNA-binding MarR family transcriptional regulator